MDWVFQCNPKRYDFAAELEKGIRTQDWSVNQHRESVSPGDRVFFWQTGQNARLLAIGVIDSPVYERESPFGRNRVDINLIYRIDPPVTRPEALEEKALATFGPFRGLMGTNFPVKDAQISAALAKVVEGRLKQISGNEAAQSAAADEHLSLDAAIKKARQQTTARLAKHISTMDPFAFEWLVRALLLKLGYADVVVTKPTGDGGVDLRATLVGSGVTKIRTCIQVKRQRTVGAPVVQSIRGSLSAHEALLLVTSGQFTTGAIAEANDLHKTPISLVNGRQLVELLLTHQIGVEPVNLTYYRLNLDAISKERLEAIVEEQASTAPDLTQTS